MGILSRFRDIMASNINALLDKAEDPEKVIREFMRSLQSDLGKVKAETASVMADERRAKAALDECRAEIKKLQSYAEKSVEAGNDEDARRFLERKAVLAAKEAQLQASYDSAASNAANMKQMNDKLVSDIGQLEARHAALQGKMAAAKMQQKLNSIGSPMSGAAESVFGNLEEKVNQTYDEAMALAELRAGTKDDLDELFKEFEKSTNTSPDDELAAIKKKMNKNE
ncbi:PspA/IM30 family protein [Paenibacillus piri]|uniref:PspA/IM30 family protein n=1 Tax=Paenibacillus piri TaxID=2547395 RepID=A0A4R5KUP3_9BACL|nr:PspA/IM30 family protein [Paenibacillus piri]TDF99446.1 PspA/IM30 family protein [Paenibacillus piri]